MGKNKLKKFRELEDIPFVLQYPWASLRDNPFPYRGRWNTFFGNDRPITLELGCGKGEYTVGLGCLYPERNFIGVDIKGARMWNGAKEALSRDMNNIAFLRTDIELLPNFFDLSEVDEIWITFPDPQMQKTTKRLTGTRLIEVYRSLLRHGGRINLKTDSPFLYNYTRMMCAHNNLEICTASADIYSGGENPDFPAGLLSIRTHYENQWIARGLTIKFLSFIPAGNGMKLTEPPEAGEIEKDTYRSYSRGYIQMPQLMNDNE